jgi:hypothetical protein
MIWTMPSTRESGGLKAQKEKRPELPRAASLVLFATTVATIPRLPCSVNVDKKRSAQARL